MARPLSSTIEHQLIGWAEKHSKRDVKQTSFRPKYNTIDYLVCLQIIIEERQLKEQPLYFHVVNIEKDFDIFLRTKLLKRMENFSISISMKTTVTCINKMQVEDKDGLFQRVHEHSRRKQGCPLSPTLFRSMYTPATRFHPRSHRST